MKNKHYTKKIDSAATNSKMSFFALKSKKITKQSRKIQLSASLKKAREVTTNSKIQKHYESIKEDVEKKLVDLSLSILSPKRDVFCSHLTIGSSLFARFINGNYMLKLTHNASKHAGAYSSGAYWEEFTKKLGYFTFYPDKTRHYFAVHGTNEFKISKMFPFIGATPDLIVRLTATGELILIEVKSTTDKVYFKRFKNQTSDAVFQLKAALNVFSIRRGVLICYLVKKETYLTARLPGPNEEARIEEGLLPYNVDDIYTSWITGDGLFEKNKEKIIDRYADYLTGLSLFPLAPTNNFKKSRHGFDKYLDLFRSFAKKLIRVYCNFSSKIKFAETWKNVVLTPRLREPNCQLEEKMKDFLVEKFNPIGRPVAYEKAIKMKEHEQKIQLLGEKAKNAWKKNSIARRFKIINQPDSVKKVGRPSKKTKSAQKTKSVQKKVQSNAKSSSKTIVRPKNPPKKR